MAWYPKANQSIKGNSGGSYTGGPFKGVLHTTEGSSPTGAIATFKKNNSWPHFLIDNTGKVWQFIDTAVSSRALRNLSGGVQTNRDSVVQIDLTGFASKPNEHSEAQLNALKEIMRWVEITHGVVSRGPGRPFATAYGQNHLRFTNTEWDNFNGWCFPEGTLVVCKDGLKDISEIQIGDEVLTHKNNWKKVIKTQNHMADTVVLKGHGHYGLMTTREHPFYSSYQVSRSNKREKSSVSHPKWVNAENMEGLYWHSPTIFPVQDPPAITHVKYAKKSFKFTPELFWVIGRWLGDGTVDNKGKFQISCHSQETGQIEKYLQLIGTKYYVIYSKKSSNIASVNFNCLSLGNWVTQHFGKYSYGKTVPSWALGMPKEYREALLNGYLSADGHVVSEKSREFCTVSKKLAIGLKLLAQSLGAFTTLFFEPRKNGMINGREVNQRDRYRCRIILDNDRWLDIYNTSNTIASKVKSVVPSLMTPVYNITVEDDESYIADGIIVHNCGHCHVPENQHWDPGAINLDSLLLKEIKPMYLPNLTLEPIAAHLSHNGGVYLAADSGAFYAFDAPAIRGANGQDYFSGRHVARLYPGDSTDPEIPSYVPRAADGIIIRTTSNEWYGSYRPS